MAYSSVRYTLTSGNIGTNSFSYSAFQTLGAGADPENTQFDVYWNDTLLVLNTDYSVNTTTNTITMLSPVTTDWTEGEVIAIKRDTKKDTRYVDWTDNAGITAVDLDLEGDQLLFIAQEAWDEAQNALRKNASLTRWEGEGLPSYNCAPAVAGSGWTTLDQVNNLINGGETAPIADVNDWCFTGDGSTADFVMNGASANTTEENLWVSVNGVPICPCDTSVYNPHPWASRVAPHLTGVSRVAATSVGKGLWDSALDTVIADVVAELAAAVAANALTTEIVDSLTVRYLIQVDTLDSGSGAPTPIPYTFIGTAAQCIAEILGWNGSATWSGYVDWYDIVSPNAAYTWDQATRTLSFPVAPLDDADICVRQITGTVAVDLADVSLDGSEIQDDAINIDHLDFAAGTAYRVLKVDAAGDPSVGTITSAYVSDFTAAVQSLQWRTMTAPTSSVNMNTQKITSLQAGAGTGEAVNWDQLNTTNGNVTTLTNRINGGSSGDSSETALAVVRGVQPDMYYNNASNSRGVLLSDGSTACNLEATSGDSQILMSGFVPRYIRIFMHGDLRRADNTHVADVDHVWEFYNWDNENGFTSEVSTEGGGSRRVYLLNRPKKRQDSSTLEDSFDWPSSSVDDKTSFYLIIETIAPYRVWMRCIEDVTGNVLKVTENGVAANPGCLQVIAYKGL